MINNRFYLKNNYFDSNLGKNELNSKSQANDTQTKCVETRSGALVKSSVTSSVLDQFYHVIWLWKATEL